MVALLVVLLTIGSKPPPINAFTLPFCVDTERIVLLSLSATNIVFVSITNNDGNYNTGHHNYHTVEHFIGTLLEIIQSSLACLFQTPWDHN